MARVTPYQTGFEIDDSQLTPGAIFRKNDGSLWEIAPDGSQAPLGSGGSGAVQQKAVSLTSAQIKALFSSPVTLVEAPGAGKAIQVLGVFANYTAGGTPYTDGDGEVVAWGDANTAVAENFWDLTSADSNGGQPRLDNEGSLVTTLFENVPLVLACATTDPTDGDGTAKVSVLYAVADV